jgi:hypothetical protein
MGRIEHGKAPSQSKRYTLRPTLKSKFSGIAFISLRTVTKTPFCTMPLDHENCGFWVQKYVALSALQTARD